MIALLILLLAPAWAASPIEQAQQAELDRVRAKVANQIHLSAVDLVDELVYGWSVDPVFDKPTPVVLAGVTVPLGLGTGLQALVENHVNGVIIENPSTHVQLVHCPTCTQVVVQSGPQATVVSRGIDNPAVLAELGGSGGKHALFIDIEAEGASLVLRARLTRLDPDLPVVWSRTISTSASTPALLRAPDDLKSPQEARAEYLAALEDRGNLAVIGRIDVRTYARPDSGTGTPPPPLLWIQAGAELAPTEAMDWMASFVIGGSWIPQAYQGLMAEARIHRLLTGRTRSHIRPDLYLFGGGAIMSLWGPAAASFQQTPVSSADIVAGVQGQAPRNTLGTLSLGVELRLSNRVGFTVFTETLPSLRQSQNVGRYGRILGINLNTVGTEVTLCF